MDAFKLNGLEKHVLHQFYVVLLFQYSFFIF